MDGGAADFVETESSMEGVRGGIGRKEIDFTDDARVAGVFCTTEEIRVERFGVALAASERRSDDAIDVDEAVVALAEPEKIGAVVSGGLIEGEEERRGVVKGRGGKAGVDQAIEVCERERR